MSFRSIVRELKGLHEGIGSISRRRQVRKHLHGRTRSHIAPDETLPRTETDQGKWANLPPELLLDIIKRLEESETSWPDRAVVVYCASVCKSWREVTKEVVQTPEQCGKLTFPISLKQAGPRDAPIQCFIRRDSSSSTYFLFYGLMPSDANEKLLLVAKRRRRATRTTFVISLVADGFSGASREYVGKLKSNFLGTKFTIYDSESSRGASSPASKQAFPRSPGCDHCQGTVKYELNVLRTRGPRRMRCVMHSIPFSAIEEGGSVPTPSSLLIADDDSSMFSSQRELLFSGSSAMASRSSDALVLKNMSPRWHEQLQCWCLNFKGRVTVASVKNFQLVAGIEGPHNVPETEHEKVILQFGKIGKDIFTMDYCYPLSAFQAFAICLSGFDTKPACE